MQAGMCVSSNKILFNYTFQDNLWTNQMKEKENKEMTKNTNLTNGRTQGMNREETTKESMERKKLQSLLRDTMKKVASRKTDEIEEQAVQQEKNGKKKKTGSKRKPIVKEKSYEK